MWGSVRARMISKQPVTLPEPQGPVNTEQAWLKWDH